MRVDRSEFRAGLAETRRYLLSHHEPADWDRCYAPVVRGRRVRLCARCAGIYPGILAGIVAYLTLSLPVPHHLVIGLLPAPALVDWALTAGPGRRGRNSVRTVTGGLLGCGYGLGLGFLLGRADLGVAAIGLGYACVAGAALSLRS